MVYLDYSNKFNYGSGSSTRKNVISLIMMFVYAMHLNLLVNKNFHYQYSEARFMTKKNTLPSLFSKTCIRQQQS